MADRATADRAGDPRAAAPTPIRCFRGATRSGRAVIGLANRTSSPYDPASLRAAPVSEPYRTVKPPRA
jgi:hypothetical protein